MFPKHLINKLFLLGFYKPSSSKGFTGHYWIFLGFTWFYWKQPDKKDRASSLQAISYILSLPPSIYMMSNEMLSTFLKGLRYYLCFLGCYE